MDVVLLVDGGIVETLQVSPLVRTLAAGLPEGRITVACPPVAAGVVQHVQGVAAVLPLGALGGGGRGGVLPALVALRRRRFHAAALCSTSGTVYALAYLAGIPLRAGLREGPARILLTHDTVCEPGENRSAAWLRLAPLLGVEHRLNQPAYEPGEAARRLAEDRMVGSGFEDGRLMIAVAPGVGFSDPLPSVSVRSLTWEPERFAHLCNQVSRRHGAGVVVLGTHADRPYVDAMLLDVEGPVLDLCGELADLDQVAAVLERCDLLICGDSPLLHLAAAVGTASVGLFGPTDGRSRAPYGADHRVVQAQPIPRDGASHAAPDSASLRDIRVDDVLAGIESPL